MYDMNSGQGSNSRGILTKIESGEITDLQQFEAEIDQHFGNKNGDLEDAEFLAFKTALETEYDLTTSLDDVDNAGGVFALISNVDDIYDRAAATALENNGVLPAGYIEGELSNAGISFDEFVRLKDLRTGEGEEARYITQDEFSQGLLQNSYETRIIQALTSGDPTQIALLLEGLGINFPQLKEQLIGILGEEAAELLVGDAQSPEDLASRTTDVFTLINDFAQSGNVEAFEAKLLELFDSTDIENLQKYLELLGLPTEGMDFSNGAEGFAVSLSQGNPLLNLSPSDQRILVEQAIAESRANSTFLRTYSNHMQESAKSIEDQTKAISEMREDGADAIEGDSSSDS